MQEKLKEWKWEYDNLCKFANQFQDENAAIKAKLVAALKREAALRAALELVYADENSGELICHTYDTVEKALAANPAQEKE